MSVLVWLGIALLGGVGAQLRFGVDAFIQSRVGGDLPWGTLVVNVAGAFGLGILTGLDAGGDTLLLAGGATIGSFTTFSTWLLESQRLAEEGESGRALANVGLSFAAGLAAAVAGWQLGAAL